LAPDREQEKVVRLVRSIQESQQHLATTTEGTTRYQEIEKHLKGLDSDLDSLIYSLAGLTPEEVLIVETQL
jgi:hypothetical protein